MLLVFLLAFSQHAGAEYVEVSYTGTAFVVHPDGYLLTCAHMIDYGDAETVTVTLEGKNYPASVLEYDSQHDLALLQIQVQKLSALPLVNSNSVRLGEEVRAVGYPLSNLTGGDIKMTRGSIAGITTIGSSKAFQIDAPVNEGNSGGPIINERGEVVGIINAKLTEEGVEGVGFAIPANYARNLLRNQFIEPLTLENGEKLDGPALAQRVTPAVAFLTVKTMEWKGEEGGEDEEEPFTWDSIRAKRIELVDDKGMVRSAMQMGDEGPILALFDATGKVRGEFRTVKEGPSLMLFDEEQKGRIGVALMNGIPSITLIDANGKTRGGLVLLEDEPGLFFGDGEERDRLVIRLIEGEPFIDLYDAAGNPRGVFAMVNNLPAILLYNKSGKVTWKTP